MGRTPDLLLSFPTFHSSLPKGVVHMKKREIKSRNAWGFHPQNLE